MEGCGSRKCHKESPPTSFNNIFWWLTTLMTLHQFTVINIRGTIPIYWLTSKITVKISRKSHKYFLFFFIYSVSLSLANILLQIVHNKSPILCPTLLVLLKLSKKYVKFEPSNQFFTINKHIHADSNWIKQPEPTFCL